MSESSTGTSREDSFGVGSDRSWESLPKEIREYALAEALKFCVQNDTMVLSPENLTEALGPEQLRLLATQIELSDEEISEIAEDINQSRLQSASESQSSVSAKFAEIIDQAILRRPQATLYATSLSVMLVGVAISNTLVIIMGGVMLIMTGLHYNE